MLTCALSDCLFIYRLDVEKLASSLPSWFPLFLFFSRLKARQAFVLRIYRIINPQTSLYLNLEGLQLKLISMTLSFKKKKIYIYNSGYLPNNPLSKKKPKKISPIHENRSG